MSANAKAQTILKEIGFDFTAFTMDGFLRAVGEKKKREIIAIPWNMPSALFGAWISDGNEPREYIFYRNDVLEAHQIHIQLHELSHFLFGHPTLSINKQKISEVVSGISSLPFVELPRLRASSSKSVAALETEAEVLANLIQEKAIQNSKIDLLIHNTQNEEKLARFLKGMGA